MPAPPMSLLWFDAVLQRSNPVAATPAATSTATPGGCRRSGDGPRFIGGSPGRPIGSSTWQIARSAEAMIGAIGASSAAKS